MIINLGYVALSVLLKDSSPNRTITLKSLSKIKRDQYISKVMNIAKSNIDNTMRILKYNKAYGIKLYRMTSKIIPLVTHKEFEEWDWKSDLKDKFNELGNCVKENGIRISTHPDHFTLLNSPKPEVFDASLKDLQYHSDMFELMNLGYGYKFVIHVGGMYNDKERSIERFYDGFNRLDERIKKRIILENDDKIYNAEDVLKICTRLGIPMVLDVHHDRCNPSKYKIHEMLPDIFQTWKGEMFPPKIHVSSEKSAQNPRSHSDFINSSDFIRFVMDAGRLGEDFDVMIEAKMKDKALFTLMDEIKSYPEIECIGDATIRL